MDTTNIVFALCLFIVITINLNFLVEDLRRLELEYFNKEEMVELALQMETLDDNSTGIKADLEKKWLEKESLFEKNRESYEKVIYFSAFWEFLVLNLLLDGYRKNSWKTLTFVLLSPYIRRFLEQERLLSYCNFTPINYYTCYHRVDTGQVEYFLYKQFGILPTVPYIICIVLHAVILLWSVRLSWNHLSSFGATPEQPPNKRKPSRSDSRKKKIKPEKPNGVRITRRAPEAVNEGDKPVRARLQKDQHCFYHACLYGHGETVLAILADTTLEIAELEPLSGQTAFHLACIRGHLSIVQYLHKKFGAKVCFNLKNRDELTGLEVATELGKADVVQNILQAVPKKQTRRAEGLKILKSALKLSVQNDRHDIAKEIYNQLKDTKFTVNEHHFAGYFESYQDTCSYLANLPLPRTIQEQIDRETKIKTRDAYKNYICSVLNKKESNRTSSSTESSADDEDLDCPVCFEFMGPPRRIFACHNGHLLCSVCRASPTIKSCPLCRDDFKARKPKRALAAEEKAKKFQTKNTN